MTAAVNQASTVAATVAPAGGRNPRHAGGSATVFGDTLGAVKQRGSHSEANDHAQVKSGTHQARRHHAHAAADEAIAGTASDSIGKQVDATATATNERLLGRVEAASPEADDEDGRVPDSDDDARLPTQIKAEQTISAMMAMAPIERRIGAAGDAIGKPGIKAERPVRAETGASAQSRSAPIETNSAPQADTTPQASAAGGSEAAAKRAAAQPAEVLPAPVDSGSRPAKASTDGKPEREAEVGDGGKAGRPSQSDAPEPAPQSDAAPAPKSPTTASDEGSGQSGSDSSASQDRAPEARRNEPHPVAAKVSVVAQQAAPAPVAPQLSANATAVVTAIAGDQSWRLSNASADSLLSFRNAQPMRSLKIELHPVELGTVTANLKTAGEQLSVELQVDNQEAYHRLSADSDAIVKSLRSLGYDIDQVSIQQPQAATTIVARSDASANAGSFSRDASSFQSGNPGNGGERFGGQTSGREGRNDGQRNDQAQQVRQDRAGDSLYI